MAFYLDHLPDGKLLRHYYKTAYLIKLWPGTIYLGTTMPANFRFSYHIPADILKEIEPPTDFFSHINTVSRKSDLVCVAQDDDHDAACWIDIPRQLDICSMADHRIRHWLIVPDAHKMIDDDWHYEWIPKLNSYELRKKQTTQRSLFAKCIQKIHRCLRRRSA